MAAEFGRLVDRDQSEVARQLFMAIPDVVGDLAVVHLGVDLPGNQFFVDEAPGTGLKFPIEFS